MPKGAVFNIWRYFVLGCVWSKSNEYTEQIFAEKYPWEFTDDFGVVIFYALLSLLVTCSTAPLLFILHRHEESLVCLFVSNVYFYLKFNCARTPCCLRLRGAIKKCNDTVQFLEMVLYKVRINIPTDLNKQKIKKRKEKRKRGGKSGSYFNSVRSLENYLIYIFTVHRLYICAQWIITRLRRVQVYEFIDMYPIHVYR